MKCYILFFYLSFYALEICAQDPIVSTGRLDRVKSFPSAYVESRNIDIWLPEGYNRKKKYAVLYMHDGQMLFDSTTTWNKKAWDVDDVAAELIKDKKVKDFIIVGIWNGGPGRHAEYFPQKPFESLPQSVQDTLYGANRSNGDGVFKGNKVQSDNYLLSWSKNLNPILTGNMQLKKTPPILLLRAVVWVD
jgi:Putative esterase